MYNNFNIYFLIFKIKNVKKLDKFNFFFYINAFTLDIIMQLDISTDTSSNINHLSSHEKKLLKNKNIKYKNMRD